MAVPLAPVNVQISELTSTSVKVSAQQGQSGLTSRFFYIVRTDGTGGKFQDATFVSGNIFSAVITNLTPDDQYTVMAGVMNSDGQSPYSSQVVFTTYLNYREVPAPPSPSAFNITSSSVQSNMGTGYVYGRPDPIEWEIRIRKVGETVYGSQMFSSPGSTRTFSGLARATQYVLYGRARNEVGWSDFSDFTYFTTSPTVPDVPNTPVLSEVTQTTVRVDFTVNENGGSVILERELSWGTNPSFSSFSKIVPDGSNELITGLTGGTTYYVWARVRNEVGWSNYSGRASIKTIAGAFVKWNGVVKEAVPWVKINGVWKVAKPWVKIAGAWKGVK